MTAPPPPWLAALLALLAIVASGFLPVPHPPTLPLPTPTQPGTPGAVCHHGAYSGAPIVAYGNSLTEGYSASIDCGYALMLQDLVHRDVVQIAHGGYTSGMMLPYLPAVLAAHPALVVVELGTNDERASVDTAQYNSNLLAIFAALRGIPVVCLTIWPSPGHDDSASLFRYNQPIYADCPGPVVDITSLAVGGNVDPATWHPNDAGHLAIAQAVARAIGVLA